MPPKKRTVLSNADQAAPSRKNQKRANDQQAEQAAGPEEAENAVQEIEEGEESSSSEDLSKKDPQEWICMDRPFWDFKLAPDLEDEEGGEREDEEEGDSDDEGPNSLRERYEKQVIAKKLFAKPAAEFPQHKWKILWDAWMQIVNLTNQESYRQPDNFDIYMWSHHYNYAIMGLVEDSLVEFNKTYSKKPKSPEPSNVRHMWATLAALGHWFHMGDEPVMQFIGVDDGGRAIDLTFLLGSAFLTTLDAMERMGWLKPGSEMRDLGLVMSMWLQWSFGLPDYGIEGDDGKITWRKDIIAYAKRGNIDL